MMTYTPNDLLKALNDWQDACDKAKAFSDAMQLMQIYNNAAQMKNYLILASCYYPNGYYTERISQCNSICDQCNHALNDLANKALHDAIMGKLRELTIRN